MDPEQPKDATTVTDGLSRAVIMDYFRPGLIPAVTQGFILSSIMIRFPKPIFNGSANDFSRPIIMD